MMGRLTTETEGLPEGNVLLIAVVVVLAGDLR